MKTTWTYGVNEDAQIDINFVAVDERGKATGGVTITRANSLAIAKAVLERRYDVAQKVENVVSEIGRAKDIAEGERRATARIVAALRNVDRNALTRRLVWRDNVTDFITDLTSALADDIAAGRL